MGINATYDLISSLTVSLFNINGSRSDHSRHISKCGQKNHDPLPLQVQESNRMKYDTQTKMISYDLAHTK